MTATTPSPPTRIHNGADKALTLALSLAQAEKAILEFSKNQIDAIVDTDGHAYLLRPAQEDLRRNERRLQAVIDSLPDVLTVVDRSGIILSQSKAVTRVFGYEPDELVGRNIFELVYGKDMDRFYDTFFGFIEGIHDTDTVQLRHPLRAGSYRLVEASIHKVQNNDSAVAVLCFHPLSDPKGMPLSLPSDRLADVLECYQGQIFAEWSLQAIKLFPGLDLDKLTITDHLQEVIAEIIRDLAQQQKGDFSSKSMLANPEARLARRFHEGLNFGTIVAKYNLVRSAFITVAERHHVSISGEAAHIINGWIDGAVRRAVVAFAAQQALVRQERDKEHLTFIAHDLRMPLNAISLLAEELKLGLDEDAMIETGDLFEVLNRNIQHVEDLIKRVVEKKASESNLGTSFQPLCSTFELGPLVQGLIRDLGSVSSRHSIEVVQEIPAGLTLYADIGLISEVLRNLLDNACKYTAHGRVLVKAWNDAAAVTCVVSDNGAGISPEMLPHIFDKHITDPNKQGTGLGLAIVKQIVVAHGGKVRADSTFGAGAAFRFTIPSAIPGSL